MDVVWIFYKILRIIYEKRDFKEKTKFEWMCLDATNVIMVEMVDGRRRKCIQNISENIH